MSWVEKAPLWQRIALRMLTECVCLSEEQVETLTAVALRQAGHEPPFGDAQDTKPITGSHLGTLSSGRSGVRLAAIANPSRVNSLEANQRLEFARDGLTVIYGDNGSGKSGYARILKRTCGSRCTGKPILPNVYGTDPTVAAEAELEYEADGTSESVNWADGKDAEPILPEVGYFDLECAAIQISGDNTVLLTPPGLDLLQRLADACAAVKERLASYAAALSTEAPAIAVPDEFSNTRVRDVIDGLSAESDPKAIRRNTLLAPEDEKRLQSLVEDAKNDPAQLLKNCGVATRALEATEKAVEELAGALGDEALRAQTDAAQKLMTAEGAARLASQQAFSSEPLPGVGTPLWKALWQAAREYAESEGHPGEAFPAPERPCPLCQQPLDDAAKARFGRFDQYMKAAAQAAVTAARDQLASSEKPFLEACKRVLAGSGHVDVIESDDKELASELRRLGDNISNMETFPDPKNAPKLRILAQGILDKIAARKGNLTEMAAAAAAANNPEAAASRDAEISELKARQWLSSHLGEVDKRVATLKVKAAIDTAARDCGTIKISNLVSTLAEEHVTKRLEDAFADELAQLQVRRVPVVLANSGTRRGKSMHKVQLCEAVCDVSPTEVLSEGEQKCIALAGFLAEVGLRDDDSAVVFDDPVTSLDHRWRVEVARRLAKEATRRQVIVFTHDIVFLMILLEEAALRDLAPTCKRLRRSHDAVGICEDGLPWAGMTVSKKLGVLKNRVQTDSATYRRDGEEAYAASARVTYAMLREAWERGVEELLLNGAVERFRRSVETKRLQKVSDVTERDIEAVEQGMSKCSRFMVGHDESAALNEPVPTPEELASDIAELETWLNAIRKRRSG